MATQDSQTQSIDLASLMQSASAAIAQSQDTISKLKAINSSEQSSYSNLVADTLAGTDSKGDTPLSKQVKVMGELEAQTKEEEFYLSLGMGGEGAAKISNQLAQHYTDSLQQALELSGSIKERESVGFFDNPISYLWNQMILPDEKNALHGAVSDAELAASGLAKINEMAQQTHKTEELYKKTTSLAAAESLVTATSAEIAAKAEHVKIASAESNAQGLERVARATAQELEIQSRVLAAKNSEEHLALSREAAGRERARFQQWQQEAKDTQDYVDNMAALVEAGAKITGRATLDRKTVQLALKTGKGAPALFNDIKTLAEVGYVSSATGSKAIAETPLSAAEISAQLNIKVPQAVSALGATADSNLRKTAEMPGSKLNLKDKTSYSAAFNSEMEKLVKTSQKEIDPAVATNPFLIAGAKALAEKSDAVKTSALFTKVLAAEITAGKLNTQDIGVIIDKGVAAVGAGTLTFQELRDGIKTYLNAGVRLKAEENQFEKFAIAPIPTSYNAKIMLPARDVREPGSFKPFGNVLTGQTPVVRDLLDQTVLDSVLASKMSRRGKISQSKDYSVSDTNSPLFGAQ